MTARSVELLGCLLICTIRFAPECGGAEEGSAPREPLKAGLRLWLDAADGATVVKDASGSVVKWLDKSGDGFDAILAKPGSIIYPGPRMNSRPTVGFRGEGFLRTMSIRKEPGGAVVFVVSQRLEEQASDAKWQRLFSSWGGGAPADNKKPSFCVTGIRKGSGAAYRPSIDTFTDRDVVLEEIGVGGRARDGGNRFRGDIAELLVYDHEFLSIDQTQQVLTYLSKKWGAPIDEGANKGWTRRGPLGDTPKRTTDALPLSDQANKGSWVRHDAMWDEFDGDRLDGTKWWRRNPKWKGRQPAFFSPNNVSVSDGQLHLVMRKEDPPDDLRGKGYHTYSSAAVQSKERVLYGYFEIEARAMASGGSSAFWFYDNTKEIWTEIDVFEIGGRAPGFERKYNMNLHVFHTPKEKRHWSVGGMWMAPWDLADDFHVYGLEWDENRIKYYVDGVLVRDVINTHWRQPLTLNFDSETMPNWFGLPKDQDLPSTFSVKYVRAWKRQD